MTEITYPFSLPNATSAAEVLARMRVIVQNERLEHSQYVFTPDVKKSEALCGGHKFCAIGAAWFAAGARIVEADVLEGVYTDDRDEFVPTLPYLAETRDALNAVARRYLSDIIAYPIPALNSKHFIGRVNGVNPFDEDVDALERLFETRENVTTDTLLAVIDEAIALVTHGKN